MGYNPNSTGQKLALTGSTSGTISQFANATTASYSLHWPAAQAAGSNYVLTNDGAGNLSWVVGATALPPGGSAGSVQYNSGSSTFSGGNFWTDGNNVAINTTYGYRFNGPSDDGWQIGRNLSTLVAPWLSSQISTNVLEFICGNGSDEGIAFGNSAGTHYFELDSNSNAWFGGSVHSVGSMSGSNLSGTNTGDVTLAPVGSSPSTYAASLSGQLLQLQPFSSAFPGVVLASGGGTTNFLRADGTWAAPATGSNVVLDGGNSFGAPMSVGTNDNYDFNLIRDGSTQISLTQQYTPQTNASFFASYGSTINADYGSGSLTGTATGSPAIVSSKLALSGAEYVSYSAVGNATGLLQTGTIRFNFTPTYTGNPSQPQSLFSIAGSGNVNLIYGTHYVNGDLLFLIYDDTGTIINFMQEPGFSPVAGTTYELEFDFDITGGASRIFANGVQIGSTATGTGTRSTAVTNLYAGYSPQYSPTNNFSISDFILYITVQHTSNFTGEIPRTYAQTPLTAMGAISVSAFQLTTSPTSGYVLTSDAFGNGTWQAASGSITPAQPIASTNIDWSTGDMFTQTLSGSTTFTFSGQVSGQVIVVRLTNTSTYTVTWPGSIAWPGGTPPIMTTGAHTDVYTFIYDGTTIYGSVVQNF